MVIEADIFYSEKYFTLILIINVARPLARIRKETFTIWKCMVFEDHKSLSNKSFHFLKTKKIKKMRASIIKLKGIL